MTRPGCLECIEKNIKIRKLRDDIHRNGNQAQVIIAENELKLREEIKLLRLDNEYLQARLKNLVKTTH